MRMLTEAEQAQEVTRIHGAWPGGRALLFMKNLYTSKLGFIVRRAGETLPTVYKDCNFLQLLKAIQEDQVHTLPQEAFDSVEKLVHAGWVGD
jgi:hypothetical protein